MGELGDGVVTLDEAAERLGVHYMTAYRYVRTGRLAASQDGRRWWVRLDDLASFRAAPRRAGGERPDYVGRLVSRLLSADESGAWSVVDGALASSTDAVGVHREVLVPALVEIGERWARGDITVADEHAASAVAVRIVGRLGQVCVRPGVKRGGVLLSAVPGDLHSLPTAILTNILRVHGYAVRDLGAAPELESMAAGAAQVSDLRAVGLAATTSGNDEAIRAAVAALRPSGVPVLLGGGAVPDEATARALGADGWAEGAAVVALFDAAVSR